MGCDIHAHIELKIRGKWEHYSCPTIDRNYNLFSRICGVRNYNEITPIAPPRGLPDDLSEITRICFEWEAPDARSMTWLTKDELNGLIEWLDRFQNRPGQYFNANKEFGYLTGNDFRCDGKSNPPEFEDCRFICWFDN